MVKKPAPQASLLTPQSPSGIAVLSLVGANSQELIRRLFRPARTKGLLPSPSRATYGFMEHEGELLDEVLMICTDRKPPAYEICCHGGETSARAILESLTAQGAEVVPWSRRIKKKTLHHDLLSDLLQSEGPNQAILLAHLYGGALREAFSTLEAALRSLEPGQKPLDREAFEQALITAAALEETYPRARFLHRPPRIILWGPPNAGKSTLFNALLGERRALTSKIPGTTRDPVEASCLLQGFPVRLFDLPGCGREGASKIDDEATAVAERLARDGDLFLHILDLAQLDLAQGITRPGSAAGLHPRFMAHQKVIVVFNKKDLVEAGKEALPDGLSYDGERQGILVSALKQEGLSRLLATMAQNLGYHRLLREKSPLIVNKNQLTLIRILRGSIDHRQRNTKLLISLREYLS